MFNYDQYGFYTVGHQKFYSKFSAIEHSSKTGLDVKWNFNEAVFDLYDWTREPAESLSELYAIRARQLREKYDYLVLWFSSGADSMNILDTFIDNDIKIDELVSYVNYEADGDKFNHLNREIYNRAIPKYEMVKQKQSHLKFTLFDQCQLTIDYFKSDSAKFDWNYQSNGLVNPNNTARLWAKSYHTAWRELIDSGKRVGFIYGCEKPKVIGLNGNYYFRFYDIHLGITSAINIQLNQRPGDFDELFYWSPDLPELIIKQGHVIKNFLKNANEFTDGLVEEDLRTCTTSIKGKMYNMTLDKVNELMYPKYEISDYNCEKVKSIVYSPKDTWFFKLPDNDPAKYSWRVGLEHRWQQTPDQYKNISHKSEDVPPMFHGFKTITGKHYFLGN
jgi:hypothetical protein